MRHALIDGSTRTLGIVSPYGTFASHAGEGSAIFLAKFISILDLHRTHVPATLNLGDHDLVDRIGRRRASGRSIRAHDR